MCQRHTVHLGPPSCQERIPQEDGCRDPEELAIEWDRFVESNRGFKRLDKRREEHIAKELCDVARYRRKVLAVIEVERVEGVADILKGVCNNG